MKHSIEAYRRMHFFATILLYPIKHIDMQIFLCIPEMLLNICEMKSSIFYSSASKMSRVGSMSLLFARQCIAFNSGRSMTSSVFMKSNHYNSDVSNTNSYCTKVRRQTKFFLFRTVVLNRLIVVTHFLDRVLTSSLPVLQKSF